MNELLLMMMAGNRGLDRGRLAAYLRDERSRRERDFAKVARAVAYGAFFWAGGLKLEVKNATGTVPATDSTVSTTGKLDAILQGLAENYKALPYFGLVSEAATFVGEVIARATTTDPAMIELLTQQQQQPQVLSFAPGAQQYGGGRVMTITSPNGQQGAFRLTANGLEIADPNWSVRVD